MVKNQEIKRENSKEVIFNTQHETILTNMADMHFSL